MKSRIFSCGVSALLLHSLGNLAPLVSELVTWKSLKTTRPHCFIGRRVPRHVEGVVLDDRIVGRAVEPPLRRAVHAVEVPARLGDVHLLRSLTRERADILQPIAERLSLREARVDVGDERVHCAVAVGVDIPLRRLGERRLIVQPRIAVVRREDAAASVGVVDDGLLSGRRMCFCFETFAREDDLVVQIDGALTIHELVLGNGRASGRQRWLVAVRSRIALVHVDPAGGDAVGSRKFRVVDTDLA